MSKPFTQAERELATDLCAACLGQILGIKPETARKKLEAWAWVERHVDDIDIRGDRTTGDGWVTVTYNDGNRAEGATIYAAALDAMEKEWNA